MSGDKKQSSPKTGRRKDGRPFKEGNVRDDGSYAVGRNRPPESGKFRKGDGRKRGRRARGICNADTEFERELNRKVPINENGEIRVVTKGHSVDVRVIDNASRKGDIRSIEFVDKRRRRIAAEREEALQRYPTRADQDILAQYLRERSDELGVDPNLYGDPEPELGDGETSDG